MRAEKLADVIEAVSPLELQEPWDNSGYQIKISGNNITKVLVAMEITDKVIEEAEENCVEAIVTHHPLIFGTLKCIDDKYITGNYIAELLKRRISVYSSHTPFDKCRGGNNDYLAGLLHLCDVKVMETDKSGFCREGFIDGQCSVREYIYQISDWMNIPVSQMSFTGDPDFPVNKVGLCSGAGSDFMDAALEAGCDLFITGDVKYHGARHADELGINVLDIGHFGSEKCFTANMAHYLRKTTDLKVIESKVDLDPFRRI